MCFLGELYFFKSDGFLCGVQRENNNCMVVLEDNLMYECPYDLPLQVVFTAFNLLQSVEQVYYFGMGRNVCLS